MLGSRGGLGKGWHLAQPGPAPWKGLTVGGVIAAGVVLLGLWIGGVFDPLGPVQEAIEADGAAVSGTAQGQASGSSGDAPAEAPSDAVADTKADASDPPAGSAADDATDVAAVTVAPEQPDVASDNTPGDAAQPTPPATPPAPQDPVVVVPGFDMVRTETDGSSLVAGSAEPGARVEVLVDGQVMGEEVAGPDGKFAAFVDLPASEAPRSLTLRTSGTDGTVGSTEEVIVGPTAPPVVPGAQPGSAPTVLLSDADGVKVLQSGAGDTSDEVSLGAVTYGDDGAVVLTGRGQPGNFVRVYVDDVATDPVRIAADGAWQVVLPDIGPGDHVLRIDEVAADGSVRSRIETEFSREVEEVVADVADNNSAASGASDQEVASVPVTPAPETPAPETSTAVTPAPVASAQTEVAATSDTSGASSDPEAPAETAGDSVAETAAASASDTSEPDTATEPAGDTATAPREIVVTMVDGTSPASDGPAPSTTRVTVVKGATLWAIAREKYGEGVLYVRVYDANKTLIRNPDLIYPGQVFDLPD